MTELSDTKRVVSAGRLWLAVALLASVGGAMLSRGRLPSPVASHWGASGEPNGAMSLNAVISIVVAVPLVIAVVGSRQPRAAQRAFNAFAAALALTLTALTLWANWDRARWQDAARLNPLHIVGLVGVPILAGWLTQRSARRTTSSANVARHSFSTTPPALFGVLAVFAVAIWALGRLLGPGVVGILPIALIAVLIFSGRRPPRFALHAEAGNLTLLLKGADIVLCCRRAVVVPMSAVRGISVDDVARIPRRGIRAPGTSLPGVILAGSFGFGAKRSFWDVRRRRDVIRIELDPEQSDYCRIVIEVANPQEFATEWRKQLGAWTPSCV
jgi:hypothetical protein